MAPGTLDRQTTRVAILLDTDQDPSTGIRQQDGIGADYSIDMAASTSQATVTKADQVDYRKAGELLATRLVPFLEPWLQRASG